MKERIIEKIAHTWGSIWLSPSKSGLKCSLISPAYCDYIYTFWKGLWTRPNGLKTFVVSEKYFFVTSWCNSELVTSILVSWLCSLRPVLRPETRKTQGNSSPLKTFPQFHTPGKNRYALQRSNKTHQVWKPLFPGCDYIHMDKHLFENISAIQINYIHASMICTT